MKTFVILASCIAVASAASRGSFGGQALGGSSGGSNSGGYSSGSGNGGYSGGGGSGNRSGSGGYSGGSGSGGYSGGGGDFGSLGFGNSQLGALMSLMANSGFGGRGGSQFNSGAGGQSATGGYSQGQSGGDGAQQGGQTRRFVSVHVAPEENTPREPRIIRAGGSPDTHVNIIFVKAPSGSSEQQTEVVLPEPPQQKTLVYVLIKRPTEGENNVKIRAPPPTKPSKPEVYFIRYKSDPPATGGGDSTGPGTGYSGSNLGGFNSGVGGGYSGGSSGASGNPPSSSYGAPSQQDSSRGSSGGGYQ